MPSSAKTIYKGSQTLTKKLEELPESKPRNGGISDIFSALTELEFSALTISNCLMNVSDQLEKLMIRTYKRCSP